MCARAMSAPRRERALVQKRHAYWKKENASALANLCVRACVRVTNCESGAHTRKLRGLTVEANLSFCRAGSERKFGLHCV